MHVSIQTLQKLVDIRNYSAEQIAEMLTMVGLEIESQKSFEDDTILEVSVTPNRSDALSHYGIARELAAILQTRAKFSTPTVKELGGSSHDVAQVKIEAKKACPRYACRVIEGVEIKDSPEWLQKKLTSLGLKPINNVVDVTNWVLFERGQPLHAFDLNKLAKPNGRVLIQVRHALEDEVLTTLDGEKRKLLPSDLVIADAEKALALAGVMGGQNSEVDTSTKNILLESAYFASTGIRKTAKRLQMSTDSSYRFERGTDPNGVILALDRAAGLIQEIAGGKIRRGPVDVYPHIIEPIEVSLRPARLAMLSALPKSEIEPVKLRALFLGLGIETAGRAGHEALKFRIPTYRPDITEEIDLIEEAIRMIGFKHVPAELTSHQSAKENIIDLTLEKLEKEIKSFLSHLGFHESINYVFGSLSEYQKFGFEDPIRLQNPLGEEFSALRQSLIPGLLSNIRLNQRHGAKKLALFETGVLFDSKNEQGSKPNSKSISMTNMAPDAYANETLSLAGVMQDEDFYKLKGVLESLFERLRPSVCFKVPTNLPSYYHPGQSAELLLNDESVGFIGYLHPSFKEHAKDCIFELNLDKIKPYCLKTVTMQPLPKFPGIERDLALIVDEDILGGDILEVVHAFEPIQKILEDVSIFDVYQGKGIDKGKKSIAISISLRDKDRTLKENEVQPIVDELTEKLCKELDATIRG